MKTTRCLYCTIHSFVHDTALFHNAHFGPWQSTLAVQSSQWLPSSADSAEQIAKTDNRNSSGLTWKRTWTRADQRETDWAKNIIPELYQVLQGSCLITHSSEDDMYAVPNRCTWTAACSILGQVGVTHAHFADAQICHFPFTARTKEININYATGSSQLLESLTNRKSAKNKGHVQTDNNAAIQ